MEGKDLVAYPLVSIGIPTFNGAKRIRKALQSIFDDAYPNLEIIISDNASIDDTGVVCAEMCKGHPEVRYIRQGQNIGLIPNFEFLLRKATGKYFMWVADDDRLEPGALQQCVEFLESHPDYTLVSGAIQYWEGDRADLVESGFSFEQRIPAVRSIRFYSKVIYGGLFHGLMRRSVTTRIPCRNVFGVDYHFVANLAYSGKVKNFDWVGYHKWFGGTSRDNRKYAEAIGETKFAGRFPHLKMASDAFAEVLHISPAYSGLNIVARTLTAVSSALAILYCYYITIYPFKIGGIIKRSLAVKQADVSAPSEKSDVEEQLDDAVVSGKSRTG